uniref:Helitron helicase-like domain-containing protein n=1 Tax=Amphimedon queenslandica TaxID=400682 RepID=A0A1X7VIV8_AMPQE
METCNEIGIDSNHLPNPELYIIINGQPTKSNNVWRSLVDNVDDDSVDKSSKNVIQVGSNQYWFHVKGEVKAMIAEYGSPTLFLTLSSAEYDSADIAQYLRKRGVVGKVEQYYVKKEYQMHRAPYYHILLWIENAPVVGIDCPEEVCSFIQDRITCHIPDRGSTGAPPGGSTGAPPGGSTGAPPGGSTGAPPGGSTSATPGASTGGPPALQTGIGSAGGGGGGGGLPSPATGGGGGG